MEKHEKIEKLEEFKANLIKWNELDYLGRNNSDLRTYINRNKKIVSQYIIEAGCFKTYTVSPPPAIGGLVMQNVNPFNVIFDPPYGMSIISNIIDTIDETIGVLSSENDDNEIERNLATSAFLETHIIKNYAFVAMSMDSNNYELIDVLDAIKESCNRCGIQAERIDDPESNERITDRILESIRKAEYVIVDLTFTKPNVYYEAGYSQGVGKLPIFIAKEDTKLEFDLKDYPVIFYKSLKELKDRLEKRIRGLSAEQV